MWQICSVPFAFPCSFGLLVFVADGSKDRWSDFRSNPSKMVYQQSASTIKLLCKISLSSSSLPNLTQPTPYPHLPSLPGSLDVNCPLYPTNPVAAFPHTHASHRSLTIRRGDQPSSELLLLSSLPLQFFITWWAVSSQHRSFLQLSWCCLVNQGNAATHRTHMYFDSQMKEGYFISICLSRTKENIIILLHPFSDP